MGYDHLNWIENSMISQPVSQIIWDEGSKLDWGVLAMEVGMMCR